MESIILSGTVSNGSNLLEQFWVRVGTGIELLQRLYYMKTPDSLHLGRVPPHNQAFECYDFSLQISS
jgi:hypothetical protein